MTAQESKILRIQLYHPLMGVHNFDISSRESFADLRAMLSQHTQMTIFQNFRFQVNGKLLPEFQEIGQAINNETRINIVIQPFDQKSSFYHLQRVKEVLASPIQWVMLNSRQMYEQKQFSNEKLPENVSIDNFLELKLSSPLYESLASFDKHINFLQQLNFSIHNPPPMYRKIAGDFYYLQLKTLEGHEQHITACSLGFYVNNSSNSCFNTSNTSGLYFYNLLDLFKYLSPKFKQTFNNLKKIYKISQLDKAIFSSFKSAPLCQWVKTSNQNTQKKTKNNQWRYIMFDVQNDNNSTIKDWNEIIQLNSIQKNDSHIEVTNKEKNQFKLYQDFVLFAKQAAIKAVDNQIRPNNPEAPLSKRIYNYGSVLIWFAQDELLSYKTIQNQKLSIKAINEEIKNLQFLQNNKTHNFSLKHTVLVNYKGHNAVVQTVIPAPILSKKGQQGKQAQFDDTDKYLQQLARFLKVQSKNQHRIDKEKVERALIHPQIKVIKGDDNRLYLINLYGLSIRDLNFASPKNNSSFLRRQLISLFNQKQNCSKNVNSMIQSGYNLIFNQRVSQQHMKLKSLKTYAEQIMVPLCIQSFLRNNRKYLADSKSFVKIMHNFGLSSRYLGSIYKKSLQYGAVHLKIITQRVILAKTIKSIFRQALRKTQLGDIKSTICRLLNCIFCCEATINSLDEYLSKQDLKDQISTCSSRKRKKKVDLGMQNQQDIILIKTYSLNYSSIRPFELWEQIKQVILFKYGVRLTQSKIYMLKSVQNQYSKYALLRDVCINIGLTLQKCEYFQKQGIIFKPQHIEDVRPIVKSMNFTNKLLQNLMQQGDVYIQRKKVQQAIDVYNQAINYATSNFGVMTEQLALLNKKISQIYFRIGEIDAALLFVHCAQKMCEKLYGQSHIQTLECYTLLGQYNFFIRNFQSSEYYLLKYIHINTISYGQQYPELIIAYLNLSTLYEATSRYMDSITSISHALKIVLRVYGQNHLNTAICYAAMSTAHFQIPDIQKSIFFQQKSIEVLKLILKPEDSRIKQAQKLLQYYSHLQVSKKVKQNNEKQRKKLMSNSQLYAGFPLFRFPQYNIKDRQFMYKKMQNIIQFPPKYFF